MRRGLTSCCTRISLGALIATALMSCACVSIASAQSAEPSDPPPGFPFVPQEDFEAAPPIDAPADTSTPPPTFEEPAPADAPPVSPPSSTTAAPKVMGSKVGWSRRTLYVTVTRGSSGTVSVLRKGRRIGRKNFACPASGAVRVRVRITAAAARRLRLGAPVRVKVRTGAQRATKRMHIGRARMPSKAAVGRKLAQASSSHCTAWYTTSKVGWVWQTSSSWWEFTCFYQGFKGGHLADWYDFYFFNYQTYYQEYYGSWTRFHADGCWYYWHVPNMSSYGPYCS